MHNHGNGNNASMDQAIFRMGFSVETISVYLLCCGLVDADKPVTTANLTDVWNGTPDELGKGLRELEARHVLTRILSDGRDKSAYRLRDVRRWQIDS